MVKQLRGEKWKLFRFKGHEQKRNKYAISSRGRIASFKSDLFKDGKILKCSLTCGYKTFNTRIGEKSETLYIHREVALHFLPPEVDGKKIVIHINHDKSDNRSVNLKWVDRKESAHHQKKSPARIAFNERQKKRKSGLKLTASQVKEIKRQLIDRQEKITNRALAEKYGVCEMTIYRIKRGENWRWV